MRPESTATGQIKAECRRRGLSVLIEADGGISILDEFLGIDWKIPTDKAILSDKDTKHALLKDFDTPFHYNRKSLEL